MTLLWGGLALGAVYALVGIGYNIVFLTSKTFNFAHAQLMMLGTFLAYWGLLTLELPGVVVLVMCIVTVAAVAVIEERIAIRPLHDLHAALVTTLGAAILLNGITQLIWGAQPLTVPFVGGDDVLTVFGGRVYPVELVLIVVAILLVIGLGLFTKRSLTGLALLAIAQDREAAILRGINVRGLALAAFAFSGALAGALGMVVGPKTFAVATLGSALALKGFVVIAIGGFGSMPGTLVGGVVIGVVEVMSARYLGSEFSTLAVFTVRIVVLMTRPAGLFVGATERTV